MLCNGYLHDSDDGCFDGYRAILLDSLDVVTLFQRGHGNAELAHGAAEGFVHDEAVRRLDSTAAAAAATAAATTGCCCVFLNAYYALQDLEFAHRQRMQHALQYLIGNVQIFQQIRVALWLVAFAVKCCQHYRLHCYHAQIEGLLSEGRFDDSGAQNVHPLQATMLSL